MPGVPGTMFEVGGASVDGSGGVWITVSQLFRLSRVGAVLSTYTVSLPVAAVDGVGAVVGDADDVVARAAVDRVGARARRRSRRCRVAVEM